MRRGEGFISALAMAPRGTDIISFMPNALIASPLSRSVIRAFGACMTYGLMSSILKSSSFLPLRTPFAYAINTEGGALISSDTISIFSASLGFTSNLLKLTNSALNLLWPKLLWSIARLLLYNLESKICLSTTWPPLSLNILPNI